MAVWIGAQPGKIIRGRICHVACSGAKPCRQKREAPYRCFRMTGLAKEETGLDSKGHQDEETALSANG
ncbi:hypothetical protein N7507_003606 [Penicillium longicatenatum]|nr:hypothetical protein N7507_003606 [Penicillium longicatenatum]